MKGMLVVDNNYSQWLSQGRIIDYYDGKVCRALTCISISDEGDVYDVRPYV